MAASPGFRDVAKVTSIAVRMSCACDGAYRKVAFKDLPAHLPQRQPQGIRRPAGRPRLTFEFLLRGSPCSEPAGRFGHMVKCPLAVSRTPQPQPHFIRGPAGRPRFTFKLLPRRTGSIAGALRRYGCGRFGVRGRLRCPSGWSRPSAPAAQHSVPRWASLLNLGLPPRRSTWSEPAGRSGHSVKSGRIRLAVSWPSQPGAGHARQSVKCACGRLAVSLEPQRQPHSIRGPCGRPRLAFGLPLFSPRYLRLLARSGIW
jgi:hypothetical protein